MTLQEQLDEAKRIAQIELNAVFSKYEQTTGLSITAIEVIRGAGYGKQTSKFLRVEIKVEQILGI